MSHKLVDSSSIALERKVAPQGIERYVSTKTLRNQALVTRQVRSTLPRATAQVLVEFRNEPVLILRENFFTEAEADHFYALFSNEIPWTVSNIRIMGKLVAERRESSMHSTMENESYTYSGVERESQPMTSGLQELKERIESDYGNPDMFLLNRYAPADFICEHADDESQIDQTKPIYSFSFGQTRILVIREKRSVFKKNSKAGMKRTWRYEVVMKHGSLIEFCPGMQSHFSHEVIKPRKTDLSQLASSHAKFSHRINVTARFSKAAKSSRKSVPSESRKPS
jgi:alkylated DNA repair dioxygenase AlkB